MQGDRQPWPCSHAAASSSWLCGAPNVTGEANPTKNRLGAHGEDEGHRLPDLESGSGPGIQRPGRCRRERWCREWCQAPSHHSVAASCPGTCPAARASGCPPCIGSCGRAALDTGASRAARAEDSASRNVRQARVAVPTLPLPAAGPCRRPLGLQFLGGGVKWLCGNGGPKPLSPSN